MEETWRLVQTPVRELEALRGEARTVALDTVTESVVLDVPAGSASDHYELSAEFAPSADAVFSLAFNEGKTGATTMRIDVPRHRLTLDRARSGLVSFSPDFPAVFPAPVRLVDGVIRMRAFVDRSSIELFVNDGETVLTCLVLPRPDSRGLSLSVESGSLDSVSITRWYLESAWQDSGERSHP